MSFVHIGFAVAGVLLMLGPLILHLLQLRQRKLVELSTFRFLFETYHREGRAMKLMEYILLALRMLLLLFIGLLFARPILTPVGFFGWGRSARAVVLVVDNSASMAATESGLSRLELAKSLTREFISRAGPEDEISLVQAHYDAEVLAAHVRGDAPLLLSKLDAIAQTPRTGRIGPALSRAAGLLRDTNLSRKQIYFLSDLQKSAWDQYRQESEQALLERDMALCLVRIGEAPPANCALLPEAAPRVRSSVHIPAEIGMTVANFSDEKRDVLLTVTLADPGHESDPPLRRELVGLAPGQRSPVGVLHTFEEPGSHTVDFQISGDAFPPDDHVSVSVLAAPVASVLLVSGRSGASPWEDEAFYLGRALQPDPKTQDRRKILVQQAACPPSQLGSAMLAGRDVVILANVPSLAPAALAAVRQFVAGGGGVLVFPGEAADTNFYNGLCASTADVANALFPARLVRTFSGDDDPQRFTFLSGIDYQHPLFALFRGAYAVTLAQPRFYRVWELAPLPGRARRLSSFSIGLDAVVEGRYGSGKVLMTAFPAQLGWSSFPLKTAFVPFVHQAVAYLCPSKWSDQLLDPEIDSTFRLGFPFNARRTEVGITGPSRARSVVPLAGQGDLYVAATNLSEVGAYQIDVKLADGKTDSGWVHTRVALRESMFEPVTLAAARRLIPNAKVTLINAGANVARIADQLAAGRPIWRILAWIAVAVLVAEFLVANRAFLPKRRKRAS